MFLTETDAQMQFRDSVRRSLGSLDRLPFGAGLRAPQIVDAGLTEAAFVGGLAIGFPEDVGGIPDCPIEFAIFHAEMGRSLVVAPIWSSVVLAGQLLNACAPEALRGALVSALVAGEQAVAVAGISSTTGSIHAEKQGDVWRFSGKSVMVMGLPQAHQLVILANLETNPALFLVDADGIAFTPYRVVDGSSAADLCLEDLCLPASSIVVEGHAVRAAIDVAVQQALIALAANALGSIERMIELTVEYMKVREQFGQPIAKFQALQHILAEMIVDFEMSKSLLNSALVAHSDPSDQAAFMNAMLSIRVAAHAVAVGESAIQIHGGIGITEEYEVGHHYRRALVSVEISRALAHNPRQIVEGQAATRNAEGVS